MMAARAPWPGAPRSSSGARAAERAPNASEEAAEDSDPADPASARLHPERGRPAAGAAPAPPAEGVREVRVASVKRVRSMPGLYEIKWRDGKRRRRAMALVDDWQRADETVRDAVAAAYPEHDRPAVQLPIQAWQ